MGKKINSFSSNLNLIYGRLGIYERGPHFLKPKEYRTKPKKIKNDFFIDGLND